MLKVTASAHVQPSSACFSSIFSSYVPSTCAPVMYVPLVNLSDADEIIVIIEETPVVNPVEERSFVVHPTQYIRAHVDQRIQHLVPLFMLSTPLLIRQAVMLLELGYRA